jgi:hypothetical protein
MVQRVGDRRIEVLPEAPDLSRQIEIWNGFAHVLPYLLTLVSESIFSMNEAEFYAK